MEPGQELTSQGFQMRNFQRISNLLCLLSTILLMLSFSGPRAAASHLIQIAPDSPKITLHLHDVSLADAIGAAMRQAGAKFRMDPDVLPEVAFERCTVHVVGKALDDVLWGLLT